MNAQQTTLIETLLPRFRSIQTPPDFSVLSIQIHPSLTYEQSLAALDQVQGYSGGFSGALPKGEAYMCAGYYSNHFWLELESGDNRLSETFFSLAYEAGNLLNEWAIKKGVSSDVIESYQGEGYMRWVVGLVELVACGVLPALGNCRHFALDVELWEPISQFAPLLRAERSPPSFSLFIPDAIRASCYAIEHLAIGPNKQDAAPIRECTQSESLVTLLQAAAWVNRSVRTLERWARKSGFPRPKVIGGGGKPHEYAWSELRPFLEKESGRTLLEQLPDIRVGSGRH